MINIGNRIVNTYLYKIEDGYVMIDTGYKNDFKSRKRKLDKLNINIHDIKYIFLTHAHDDHAGFLNEVIEANPKIKVVMNTKGIETLRKGQNSFEGGCSGKIAYLFCQIMKLLGNQDHSFPPIKKQYEENLLFLTNDNQKEIEEMLGGKIIETPGHTEDSMSLITNNGELFCGDAAMNGIPSINNNIIWINNLNDYKESWEKIIKLNPKKIYPAHGRGFKKEKLIKNIEKIDKIKLIKLT